MFPSKVMSRKSEPAVAKWGFVVAVSTIQKQFDIEQRILEPLTPV
jgi:hypothetical protein